MVTRSAGPLLAMGALVGSLLLGEPGSAVAETPDPGPVSGTAPAAAAPDPPGEVATSDGAAAPAVAPTSRPPPWLWFREQVGIGGWPTLIQSETRLQGRAALRRSESRLFQNTYVGAGGVLALSPAFLRVGPRFGIQPLDVLEVEVQGDWALILPMLSGLVAFDETSGKLGSDRAPFGGETPLGQMWSLTVSPTLRLKAGPLVVVGNAQVVWVWVVDPDPGRSPYVYEALRDLVIERQDVLIQQQYALLGEVLPGGARPLLRVGATVRHRLALGSGDLSLVLGGMVTFKPSPKPAWPTFILQVLPYLLDADRVGTFPQVLFAIQWEVSRPKGGPAR